MPRGKMEPDEKGFTDRDVAEYWDRNADVWTRQVRQGWDVYREHFNNPFFLKFIGDVSGKTILDAGCGEGRNTRLLARRGARMTGVDVSGRQIEHARQREAETGQGIRYEQTSYCDLSMFGDAAFDRVVSTMALMDGPDFEGAMREIFRVLRPGGDLCFSITHPCFMTRGFDWILDDQGEKSQLIVSDYFNDQNWVEEWKFSAVREREDVPPFAIPVFPRTLSQYVNGLIQVGFMLAKMEEARPTEAMVREYPWLKCWRDHGSLFVYFQGVKP